MSMRLTLSNLAWPADQEEAAFTLLARSGVRGVEIAPTRIAAWDALPAPVLAAYRSRLESAGLVASSLQAILFGRPDLQLLDKGTPFTDLLEHMRHVAAIAATLGANVLVFGSPRNRLTNGMPAADAWQLARDHLRQLGDITFASRVVIGIEPVPAAYGGEFLAPWRDVLRMVQEVNHPGIRVHLDTACVSLGGDDIADAIRASGEWLTHFHASEPQLGSFDHPTPTHADAATALHAIRYDRWISIEMREQPQSPLRAIETAVHFVKATYGPFVARPQPSG